LTGQSSGCDEKRSLLYLLSGSHHVATATVENSQQTANDENDERIRNVAEYFGEHLRGTGTFDSLD
jgi:hypothetical protein